MMTVAAADRQIAKAELSRIDAMVRDLPAFQGLDAAWLAHAAEACGRILARPDGIGKVVQLIAEALAGDERETAYALAAEVAASDLAIGADERNFLGLLADGLQLDDLVRAALHRSAQARYKRF